MTHLKRLILTCCLATASASTAFAAPTAFEAEVTDHLVRVEDGALQQVDAASINSKDYYVFYFSAKWCPPCRKFTPKLAEFYDQAIGHHDNFEVIFISSDRNEAAMKGYMSDYGMNFLARSFDERKSSDAINKYKGNGIPQLLILDKNGNVVADSYEDGEYVGPYKPLETLKAKLHE